MELRAYAAILWRRKWIVLLTVLTALGVAVAANRIIAPVYVATATARVSVTSGSIDYVIRDPTYTDRLLNTYLTLVTSHSVREQVAKELNLNTLPEISGTAPANSELLHVSASHRDPAMAAAIANAATAALAAQVETAQQSNPESAQALGEDFAAAQQALLDARLKYESLASDPQADPNDVASARIELDLRQQEYSSLQTQYDRARVTEATRRDKIVLADPAVPPESPSSPNQLLNLALGLGAGLVGAIGLAFLFENLDDRLYTTGAIRRAARVPILAVIPRSGRRARILLVSANARLLEAFRWLRTNLLYQSARQPLKTIVITSSQRGEGRSTVTANLAFVLAGANRRVIIIDADLRSPRQHQFFGLSNHCGLTSVLRDEASVADALQTTTIPRIQVLTSGPEPSYPPELLGSERMRQLLTELRATADLILLDAPPLEQVADAAILAGIVDGVILVVQSGRAREGAVVAAIRKLDTLQARVVGVVANQADADDGEPAESYDAVPTARLITHENPTPVAVRNGRPSRLRQRFAEAESESSLRGDE